MWERAAPFHLYRKPEISETDESNRAPGISGIPAELLKYGGAQTLLWLQVLLSIVFRKERISKDWRAGIILPLRKWKDNRRMYSNYRGITLLSVPGKLFIMTLLDRCTTFLRSQKTIKQTGFMLGRSTVWQIFTIRQLVDSRISRKSIRWLCGFQGCFRFCQPAITLAHTVNNETTSEVLQPFWVAP